MVTADEVGDPGRGLRLQTRVNGEVVQDASTADMIFPVGEILAYLSEVMTLHPGDVVATGTPQGVGCKRTPPRYLGPGDTVVVEIEGVGSVSTPIVAGDGSSAGGYPAAATTGAGRALTGMSRPASAAAGTAAAAMPIPGQAG